MLDTLNHEASDQDARQTFDYDLVVLGSGPAGQRAAIQAAKLGKHVAVIEKRAVVGGVCINTGTIPSKTLREAALHLSGFLHRNVYGSAYSVKQDITMSDLMMRTDHVIRTEIDVTHHQLRRNGIEVLSASASFSGPHTIRLDFADGRGEREVSTDKVVIAVGTECTRAPEIPFDGQTIFTSDDVLSLEDIPRSLAIIGAGVIGLEYATIFATLGVRVTLIDKRTNLLDFVDGEITDALAYLMRQHRVALRLGEGVERVSRCDKNNGPRVRIDLESGKQIYTQKALYSIGRTGATGELDLAAAGLGTDERGRVTVDANYRTEVANIYAAGDVIGFPSLASTSMEQGRLAACHAFGENAQSFA